MGEVIGVPPLSICVATAGSMWRKFASNGASTLVGLAVVLRNVGFSLKELESRGSDTSLVPAGVIT